MSEQANHFEIHLPVESENHRAIDLLVQHVVISKQKIKQAMLKGAVWLSKGKKTQRMRRAQKILHKGEVLHLYYDQKLLEREAVPAELIADLGRYSVWNKPYGMLSQGSLWGDHCALLRWAEQHLRPQRDTYLVHRLDRAANGLMLVAHDRQAAAALSQLFQNRRLDKRYRITVHGQFIGDNNSENSVRTVDQPLDGKEAVSHFDLQRYDEALDCSYIDVKIETGRKHQIRRHCMMLGFPVVGDSLYGIKGDGDKLQLTAYRLAFKCPLTGQERCFELPTSG